MRILIPALFLLLAQAATAQQSAFCSIKLGINTSIARTSRENVEALESWPGISAPFGLFSPIVTFRRGWELNIPILVLNRSENRTFQLENTPIAGRLKTNYQVGAGGLYFIDRGRKIGKMPCSWGHWSQCAGW